MFVGMQMEFGAGTAWRPEEKRGSRMVFIGALDSPAYEFLMPGCIQSYPDFAQGRI